MGYSLTTLMLIAVIALGLGSLIKYGIISKQRKRILKLEDEMLANHSRILSLEKKLADAKKGIGLTPQSFDLSASRGNDLEVKAS